MIATMLPVIAVLQHLLGFPLLWTGLMFMFVCWLDVYVGTIKTKPGSTSSLNHVRSSCARSFLTDNGNFVPFTSYSHRDSLIVVNIAKNTKLATPEEMLLTHWCDMISIGINAA